MVLDSSLFLDFNAKLEADGSRKKGFGEETSRTFSIEIEGTWSLSDVQAFLQSVKENRKEVFAEMITEVYSSVRDFVSSLDTSSSNQKRKGSKKGTRKYKFSKREIESNLVLEMQDSDPNTFNLKDTVKLTYLHKATSLPLRMGVLRAKDLLATQIVSMMLVRLHTMNGLPFTLDPADFDNLVAFEEGE